MSTSSRLEKALSVLALGILYLLWATAVIGLSSNLAQGLFRIFFMTLLFGVFFLMVGGAWQWHARKYQLDNRKELEDSLPKKPMEEQPNRFSHRLSRYLHVSEERVLNPPPPRPSQMTFWSMVALPGKRIEKSIEYIRQVLRRIHAAVHGEDSKDRD